MELTAYCSAYASAYAPLAARSLACNARSPAHATVCHRGIGTRISGQMADPQCSHDLRGDPREWSAWIEEGVRSRLRVEGSVSY